MKKTKSEILETVIKIIKEECSPDTNQINENSNLNNDLGLDSMGLFSLVVNLENEFEIYLEDDIENQPETISEIVNLIYEKL